MNKPNNYWVHRITCGKNAYTYAQRLFMGEPDHREEHYISIGWCDFSTVSFVEAIKKGGMKALNEQFIATWGKKGLARHRGNLYRFAVEMRCGDIVVVPMDNGTFAICRIADDNVLTNDNMSKDILAAVSDNKITYDGLYLRNADGKIIDMGFYRKVELINTGIPRHYATQQLYSKMKIRGTNTKLPQNAGDDIEKVNTAYIEKRPIPINTLLEEELATRTLEIIKKELNENKFEELVEFYLKSIGADRVTKPAKNACSTEMGDADRIAYFDTINVQIMVQAKKHDKATGDWAVKQIDNYAQNFSSDEYSTQLWVISTCDNYTSRAIELAAENNVRLITGIELAKMLLEAGLKGFII